MEGRKEEATGFDALVIKLMRFVNKVCLVTGGGSGIGRATSERLAAEGGKIAVVDINVKNGGQTVEAIRKAGGASIFACADVSNSDEVRAGIKLTVEKWEKIDVLVNNASIMTRPITERKRHGNESLRSTCRPFFVLQICLAGDARGWLDR